MVQVHRIDPSNAHLLDRIAPGVFDGPILPDALARMLARPDSMLFVATAEDDGKVTVIGQCLAILLHGPDRPPNLLIDNLGVTPARRRCGAGRALMEAARVAGIEAGAAWLWLGSDPESDTALPFYRALGLPMQSTEFAEVPLS